MSEHKNYQELVKGVFIGSAADAPTMVEQEECDIVIDLRAEVETTEEHAANRLRVHIPLHDGVRGQEEYIQSAVQEAVTAYQNGRIVAIH